MSGHECFRCIQCGSCPACAADALDREVVENDRLRLALETATTRAQSLSNELLDAMRARDNHRDRAATMSLMLDTIEGVATGQPGEMPTAVADGWSTALSAAVARIAAAESRAARLEAALALICDTSERNADVCICEMKRISRAALGEEGK